MAALSALRPAEIAQHSTQEQAGDGGKRLGVGLGSENTLAFLTVNKNSSASQQGGGQGGICRDSGAVSEGPTDPLRERATPTRCEQ